MRKDDSGLGEWCKHTGNVYGGRRRVNRVGRLNVKRHLQKVEKELEMVLCEECKHYIDGWPVDHNRCKISIDSPYASGHYKYEYCSRRNFNGDCKDFEQREE